MPPNTAMPMPGNGLPMPMMPPGFFGQGPLGHGMPMPPTEAQAAAEPPRPTGPADVPQAVLPYILQPHTMLDPFSLYALYHMHARQSIHTGAFIARSAIMAFSGMCFRQDGMGIQVLERL